MINPQPMAHTREHQTTDCKELVDRTLRFVAERGWRLAGTGFFNDLVRYLGENLGVAYAFCGMLQTDNPNAVQTVALWAHGSQADNISYDLKDTPCENVVGHTVCCYEEGIQSAFPKDLLLEQMGAESYAGIPLWGGDGTPLGLVAVLDTGPLHQAEIIKTVLQIVAVRAGAELERNQVLEKLRESEQNLKTFIDHAPALVSLKSVNGRYVLVNKEYTNVFGMDPAEMVGEATKNMFPAGVADQFANQETKVVRGKTQVTQQHIVPHGNTDHVHLCTKFPVFNTDGEVRAIGTISTDISENVEAQRKTQQALEQAERANRSKSDFLSHMSHELRTPLNFHHRLCRNDQ